MEPLTFKRRFPDLTDEQSIRLTELMQLAYEAGWNAANEGWNGEHPGPARQSLDKDGPKDWEAVRNDELKEVLRSYNA